MSDAASLALVISCVLAHTAVCIYFGWQWRTRQVERALREHVILGSDLFVESGDFGHYEDAVLRAQFRICSRMPKTGGAPRHLATARAVLIERMVKWLMKMDR